LVKRSQINRRHPYEVAEKITTFGLGMKEK
jgi:hypothetical protein